MIWGTCFLPASKKVLFFFSFALVLLWCIVFFVLCGTQKSVLMYFNIFFKTHMAIISLDDFCLIIFFLCFEDYSYININFLCFSVEVGRLDTGDSSWPWKPNATFTLRTLWSQILFVTCSHSSDSLFLWPLFFEHQFLWWLGKYLSLPGDIKFHWIGPVCLLSSMSPLPHTVPDS